MNIKIFHKICVAYEKGHCMIYKNTGHRSKIVCSVCDVANPLKGYYNHFYFCEKCFDEIVGGKSRFYFHKKVK